MKKFFPKAGRINDTEAFLHRAAACFRSALNPGVMILNALRSGEKGRERFSSQSFGRKMEGEISDPLEICAYALSQYQYFYQHGEDFPAIFRLMRSDMKLANAWSFLLAIKDGPGLERLFAIFLIWLLQKEAGIERQSLRPLRFELRDVEKEKIMAIKNLLDNWVESGKSEGKI